MRAQRSDRVAGFTLLELMIVVVIIAILAAIAVPAFSSYVMRAKAAEAPVFLGEIRQRQESYRAEFGRYATAPQGAPGAEGSGGSGWTPNDVSDGYLHSFPTNDPQWNQLGAHPDGAVRFQYYTLSGNPGTTPPGPSGAGFTGNDFWFIADAQADLNADGKYVTFEAYSASNKIWCSSDRGWD